MSIGSWILRPTEARRAIYVDFEGNKHMDPTLLGVSVERGVERWIVEPRFDDCSSRHKAPARTGELRTLALRLLDLAEREDRLIVSWSRHDYRLISTVLDSAEEQRRLDTVYRNAIRTARRWRKIYRPSLNLPGNTLEAYAVHLAWPTPDGIGRGTVGPWLKTIRDRLDSRGGRWSDLTVRQQQAWKDVLRHNWHDLEQARVVATRCAGGLAKRAGRAKARRTDVGGRRTAAAA